MWLRRFTALLLMLVLLGSGLASAGAGTAPCEGCAAGTQAFASLQGPVCHASPAVPVLDTGTPQAASCETHADDGVDLSEALVPSPARLPSTWRAALPAPGVAAMLPSADSAPLQRPPSARLA